MAQKFSKYTHILYSCETSYDKIHEKLFTEIFPGVELQKSWKMEKFSQPPTERQKLTTANDRLKVNGKVFHSLPHWNKKASLFGSNQQSSGVVWKRDKLTVNVIRKLCRSAALSELRSWVNSTAKPTIFSSQRERRRRNENLFSFNWLIFSFSISARCFFLST